METQPNKFLVPGAIVVAGVLVAAAIYFGGGTTNAGNPNYGEPIVSAIELTPINESDHIIGSTAADIVVVEYSDTECPYCKVFHNTLHELVGAYEGRVSWIYRHFPIAQLHAKAIKEAEATECAAELGGNQVFWSYIDTLFEKTNSNDSLDEAELPKIATAVGLNTAAFNECLTSGRHNAAIMKSIENAVKAGAQGTPYSVLVLKTPLSPSKEKRLNDLRESQGLPPDGIVVSEDNNRVALSGAFPIALMRQILGTIL